MQETAARLCLAADPAVAWVDVYCHYRGLPSYLRGLHGVKTYRALVPAEHAELIKAIGVELIRARYGRVPRDRRKNRR